MSSYRPAPGVWVARPPCDNCRANFHLHRPPTAPPSPGDRRSERRVTGVDLAQAYDMGVPLACPEGYRVGSIEEAQEGLRRAEASGSQERVFVARGDLQRLEGRPQK